jgi:F-type H+-transporting ATPase subunit b
MPQLDISHWPPQLIWLAIAFITLYVIMAKVALPRVGGVIDARRSRIQQDLDAAQRLKGETEAAAAQYEATLNAARARGHEMAKDARAKLNAEAEEERAKVDAELDAKVGEAEKRIGAMKATALADIKSVAADLAAEIVGQLTGAKVARTAAVKALDEREGA